jgi:hypothetical protein
MMRSGSGNRTGCLSCATPASFLPFTQASPAKRLCTIWARSWPHGRNSWKEFEPDMVDNPFSTRFLGAILDALDYKQLKWAGHGLDTNSSYRFLEDEYMRGDEYDQFLYDPTDFIFRKYWPRVFGALKPLENLPPLHDMIAYYMGLGKICRLCLSAYGQGS